MPSNFDPAKMDARYVYDAFKLIAATPEKEDLIIGMAKLDVEYQHAGKRIPTSEEKRMMTQFLGRPESKRKDKGRFQCIAEASHGDYAEFKAVWDDFVNEDLAETPVTLPEP